MHGYSQFVKASIDRVEAKRQNKTCYWKSTEAVKVLTSIFTKT